MEGFLRASHPSTLKICSVLVAVGSQSGSFWWKVLQELVRVPLPGSCVGDREPQRPPHCGPAQVEGKVGLECHVTL